MIDQVQAQYPASVSWADGSSLPAGSLRAADLLGDGIFGSSSESFSSLSDTHSYAGTPSLAELPDLDTAPEVPDIDARRRYVQWREWLDRQSIPRPKSRPISFERAERTRRRSVSQHAARLALWVATAPPLQIASWLELTVRRAFTDRKPMRVPGLAFAQAAPRPKMARVSPAEQLRRRGQNILDSTDRLGDLIFGPPNGYQVALAGQARRPASHSQGQAADPWTRWQHLAKRTSVDPQTRQSSQRLIPINRAAAVRPATLTPKQREGQANRLLKRVGDTAFLVTFLGAAVLLFMTEDGVRRVGQSFRRRRPSADQPPVAGPTGSVASRPGQAASSPQTSAPESPPAAKITRPLPDTRQPSYPTLTAAWTRLSRQTGLPQQRGARVNPIVAPLPDRPRRNGSARQTIQLAAASAPSGNMETQRPDRSTRELPAAPATRPQTIPWESQTVPLDPRLVAHYRRVLLSPEEEKYARLTAQRRSSATGRASIRSIAAYEQARQAYRTALDEYLGQIGISGIDYSQARFKQMQLFEDRVMAYQITRAQSRVDANGLHHRSWHDRRRQAIADAWLENDRSGRAAMVVRPAVVLGVGLGVGAALVAAPEIAIVAAGIATALGGYAIGRYIAGSVSRYKAITPFGSALLAQDAADRHYLLWAYYHGRQQDEDGQLLPYVRYSGKTFTDADITLAYEYGTIRELTENIRRRRIAERLGMVAGLGAFEVGSLAIPVARLLGPKLAAALSDPSPIPSSPIPSPVHGTPTPHASPKLPVHSFTPH